MLDYPEHANHGQALALPHIVPAKRERFPGVR